MVGGRFLCSTSWLQESHWRHDLSRQGRNILNLPKEKLNTKSSTESELVGVDDLMPQILWTILFLQNQGFKMRENIVYQDNQSSLKLENNGRGSSGGRTQQINIRYFFVTDRIAKSDLTMKNCPTGMLVADFYTKLLQGKLFRLFRNLILNIKDSPTRNFQQALYQLKNTTSSTPIKKTTLQECVRGKISENNKENVTPVSTLKKPAKPSYLDVCKGSAGTRRQLHDTRETIFRHHPALLLKLRNVASVCTSRIIRWSFYYAHNF